MQSVFNQSYNTALLGLDKRKTEPVQSEKLDALEKELRTENKQQASQQASESAGNASTPTPDMREKLQQLAPKDVDFKFYGNKLSDYSTLLTQMRTDAQRIAQPMLASTLENKKESFKLAQANNELAMLASQFGLNARADRVYKRAKKNPRMSAQDHFL